MKTKEKATRKPKRNLKQGVPNTGKGETREEGKKAKKKKNPVSRRWNCTVFEDKHGVGETWEVEKLEGHLESKLVYACASFEKGEETKTPHWHVYFQLNNPHTMRLSGVQKLFGTMGAVNVDSIHCEPAKGNAEENRDYFSHHNAYADKECELVRFWETGDIRKTGQGNRRDLSLYEQQSYTLIEMIDANCPLETMIRAYPTHFFRNFKNILDVRSLLRQESASVSPQELGKLLKTTAEATREAKEGTKELEEMKEEYKRKTYQLDKTIRNLQKQTRELGDVEKMKLDILRLRAEIKALLT